MELTVEPRTSAPTERFDAPAIKCCLCGDVGVAAAMHEFPRAGERRDRACFALADNTEEWMRLFVMTLESSNACLLVCRSHFDPSCFLPDGKSLKDTAFPSIIESSKKTFRSRVLYASARMQAELLNKRTASVSRRTASRTKTPEHSVDTPAALKRCSPISVSAKEAEQVKKPRVRRKPVPERVKKNRRQEEDDADYERRKSEYERERTRKLALKEEKQQKDKAVLEILAAAKDELDKESRDRFATWYARTLREQRIKRPTVSNVLREQRFVDYLQHMTDFTQPLPLPTQATPETKEQTTPAQLGKTSDATKEGNRKEIEEEEEEETIDVVSMNDADPVLIHSNAGESAMPPQAPSIDIVNSETTNGELPPSENAAVKKKQRRALLPREIKLSGRSIKQLQLFGQDHDVIDQGVIIGRRTTDRTMGRVPTPNHAKIVEQAVEPRIIETPEMEVIVISESGEECIEEAVEPSRNDIKRWIRTRKRDEVAEKEKGVLQESLSAFRSDGSVVMYPSHVEDHKYESDVQKKKRRAAPDNRFEGRVETKCNVCGKMILDSPYYMREHARMHNRDTLGCPFTDCSYQTGSRKAMSYHTSNKHKCWKSGEDLTKHDRQLELELNLTVALCFSNDPLFMGPDVAVVPVRGIPSSSPAKEINGEAEKESRKDQGEKENEERGEGEDTLSPESDDMEVIVEKVVVNIPEVEMTESEDREEEREKEVESICDDAQPEKEASPEIDVVSIDESDINLTEQLNASAVGTQNGPHSENPQVENQKDEQVDLRHRLSRLIQQLIGNHESFSLPETPTNVHSEEQEKGDVQLNENRTNENCQDAHNHSNENHMDESSQCVSPNEHLQSSKDGPNTFIDKQKENEQQHANLQNENCANENRPNEHLSNEQQKRNTWSKDLRKETYEMQTAYLYEQMEKMGYHLGRVSEWRRLRKEENEKRASKKVTPYARHFRVRSKDEAPPSTYTRKMLKPKKILVPVGTPKARLDSLLKKTPVTDAQATPIDAQATPSDVQATPIMDETPPSAAKFPVPGSLRNRRICYLPRTTSHLKSCPGFHFSSHGFLQAVNGAVNRPHSFHLADHNYTLLDRDWSL